jgi:DMSO/TMAO reductase YedYZ molybdopterin-dependent catalytic subunit
MKPALRPTLLPPNNGPTAMASPSRSIFRPKGGIDQSPLDDGRKLVADINRRNLLRGTVSLGALTMLTGCTVSDTDAVQTVLRAVSDFNDGVQAMLFNPNKLAPTYSADQVVKPPRFNAYYEIEDVKPVDGASWKLELAGLVDSKAPWTAEQIYKLPEQEIIVRHICVEGWDYIGQWSGPSLSDFLKRIGADTRAKYVWFKCAEGYTNTIDMPTALHPQTQMTFKFDNKILPRAYGFPMKIRMPTKLGYKNPKYVVAMEVTNTDRGGYWENQGYNWFGGQ